MEKYRSSTLKKTHTWSNYCFIYMNYFLFNSDSPHLYLSQSQRTKPVILCNTFDLALK